MPEKVQELHQIMKDWREMTHAPVPVDQNPRFDPLAEKQAIEQAIKKSEK